MYCTMGRMVEILKRYDWWKVTGMSFIVLGLLILVISGKNDLWFGGVAIGGIGILLGRGLMNNSILLFKLIRVLFLISMSLIVARWARRDLGIASISGGYAIDLLYSFVRIWSLISTAVLWWQLRSKKVISW